MVCCAVERAVQIAECTDLQGVNVTAQTFSCGVGAGSGKPRLSLGHPALGAFDHLLMFLKPRLNLKRNRIFK